MLEELRRLVRRAEEIQRAGEALGAAFAEQLARVWRDAERQIAQLIQSGRTEDTIGALDAAQVILLRDRIREVLTDAGYDAMVSNATQASHQKILEDFFTARQAQYAGLVGSSAPTLHALREMATEDLFAQGDLVATELWRALLQYVLARRPVLDIVRDLARVLDKSEATVQTLFDTQVSIFGRQVERLSMDSLGPDHPYLYVGPIDGDTRPFCLEHAGKVYSRSRIDAMDNGQLPNCFLTAGGYNCRHSWLAVGSAELIAMKDTGERIPLAAEDVERVIAWRAAKKAEAKKPRRKSAR